MTRAGSRTLLSGSHVSSMTGGFTCPIYYQGVVSVEKASMIIRYKLPQRTGKVSEVSCSHVSSMTRAGSRSVLSRSHVSSMIGGLTCPIYYQGVVSIEKGSVIIRYNLPEFIKKVSETANRSPAVMFHAWLGRRVEHCSPAAMFQAWQADVLVRYTTRVLSVLTKDVW